MQLLSYYMEVEDRGVNVRSVKAYLPLYGRWYALTFTVYALTPHRMVTTSINFSLRPVNGDDHFKGSIIEANKSDKFGFCEHTTSGYRQIEQILVAKKFSGEILAPSDLVDGGVNAARTVSSHILRTVEALVESVRQSTANGFGAGVKDKALENIAKRYDQPTKTRVGEALRNINWQFLLDPSNGGEEFYHVVNATFANNPVEVAKIRESKKNPDASSIRREVFVSERQRQAIAAAEAERQLREEEQRARDAVLRVERLAAAAAASELRRQADHKAKTLLKMVCGDDLHGEFIRTGQITVESGGYRFEIAPNEFVRCVDPQGKRASLCIHTRSLSCNPIDELVIAYLNIKKNLKGYLRMANLMGHDQGFCQVVA